MFRNTSIIKVLQAVNGKATCIIIFFLKITLPKFITVTVKVALTENIFETIIK
jgi:hypothetical protein